MQLPLHVLSSQPPAHATCSSSHVLTHDVWLELLLRLLLSGQPHNREQLQTQIAVIDFMFLPFPGAVDCAVAATPDKATPVPSKLRPSEALFCGSHPMCGGTFLRPMQVRHAAVGGAPCDAPARRERSGHRAARQRSRHAIGGRDAVVLDGPCWQTRRHTALPLPAVLADPPLAPPSALSARWFPRWPRGVARTRAGR